MTTWKHLLMACVLLAACDGNPFLAEVEEPVDPDPDPPVAGGGGINNDGAPITTGSPSPNSSIVRREATSTNEGETGNGFVTAASYDSAADTFTVDGLAFDGGNVYQRATTVGSLGPFAVYEADATYQDDVTGAPIAQFDHRALYGVSRSGDTQFAVVRTGAYVNYGYGGYIYQREGTVTLPTSGQAHYEGDYAALRDFDGAGGQEYAVGDMTLDIDFNDFNQGAGVDGAVFNRAIFDVNGNDITNDVLTALNTEFETTLTTLPVLRFDVGPGVLDVNGEMGGQLSSNVTSNGAAETFEEGTYYAVIAGDATAGGLDEVVGIIVVTADDPRFEGVTVRETGGFLLYRD